MWSIGYIVAPTLFGMLGDRTLAGNVAGRLFSIVGWIGIGASVYVLGFLFVRLGGGLFEAESSGSSRRCCLQPLQVSSASSRLWRR